MKKIYSKLNKKKLLHIIFERSNKKKRINISPKNEFLQACFIPLKKNENVKKHKHFWKDNKKKKKIVQEAWMVFSGKARIYLYDQDEKLLLSKILKSGDFLITFSGAHKLTSLSNNTKIYEFKTGPYEGQKKDLIYLE